MGSPGCKNSLEQRNVLTGVMVFKIGVLSLRKKVEKCGSNKRKNRTHKRRRDGEQEEWSGSRGQGRRGKW